MKRFKLPHPRLRSLRMLAAVSAIVFACGYYGHVRAQSDTLRTMVIPLRPLAPLSSVPVPPVFGMEGILADKTAAIQLGKALFWDMQAGSDDVQACASCHFNAGADSRANNDINPGQAGGDNSFQMGVPLDGSLRTNYHYKAGSPGAGFGGYHDGDFPFHKLSDPRNRFSVVSDVNDVSGSEGVFNSSFNSVKAPSPPPVPMTSGAGGSRVANGQDVPATVSASSMEFNSSVPDPVFSYPDPANAGAVINTRRTTGRNTPSAVNAVFNFRNFWDGRAQNVCNGNNPFGARDGKPHLLISDGVNGKLGPAFVAMENSALCSQALGPILSSTEMSGEGRNFHHVGRKLLARVPLAKQMVDPTDSMLGAMSNSPRKGIRTSYTALIKKAFLPEWWQFAQNLCVAADDTIVATGGACPAGSESYSQMEFNFSLFWGVAIQMYESTLIADQTPLDKFLEQQQIYTLVGDNQQNAYTIQLPAGIDPYTVSVIELNPHNDFSDSEVYAFDNGYGAVQGEGITQGSINYASGVLRLFFDVPPTAVFPVRITYATGPTPMTQAQLRGLLLFQTKGRCVVCHGGPELSNASVGTVSAVPLERMVMGDLRIRIYDTGYYHIGVRPGAEDAGLAGSDPVAGMPLSQSEVMRQRVCDTPGLVVMVPGRPGDGISQAPLNCRNDIARTGFFKTPQLRNVALTAPYFHNGSQLTLEQVVEFYNRGGDFNLVTEQSIMDPDVDPMGLGLTLQEERDLVDFLRNALTDPRTVVQSAPFDHPQLLTPNGHPFDDSGYPVQSDPQHPGQATDQYMEIPATGRTGGKPMPTFLDNLLGRSGQ